MDLSKGLPGGLQMDVSVLPRLLKQKPFCRRRQAVSDKRDRPHNMLYRLILSIDIPNSTAETCSLKHCRAGQSLKQFLLLQSRVGGRVVLHLAGACGRPNTGADDWCWCRGRWCGRGWDCMLALADVHCGWQAWGIDSELVGRDLSQGALSCCLCRKGLFCWMQYAGT